MLGGLCDRMTVRSDSTGVRRGSDIVVQIVQSVAQTMYELRDSTSSIFTEISESNPKPGDYDRCRISTSFQLSVAFVNRGACLTERWAILGKYKGKGCRRKRNIWKEMWKGKMHV